MSVFDVNVTLTLSETMTCAYALIAYALQPDSTDERIRNVTALLRALDYSIAASALEAMQES